MTPPISSTLTKLVSRSSPQVRFTIAPIGQPDIHLKFNGTKQAVNTTGVSISYSSHSLPLFVFCTKTLQPQLEKGVEEHNLDADVHLQVSEGLHEPRAHDKNLEMLRACYEEKGCLLDSRQILCSRYGLGPNQGAGTQH